MNPGTLDPRVARDDWVHRNIAGAGVTQKRTWDACVNWVLTVQLDWESLPAKDAVIELRKGHQSVFYPLFKDDPTIWAYCPTCMRRVVVNTDGFCDTCTYEFDK